MAILTNELNLFVYGDVSASGNLNLNIRGSQSAPEISCPTLDPTASIQISDDLIQIYQSRIDALINQLGKNVLLIFDPIIEPCTNCFFDIVGNRSNGIYRPGGSIPFSRGQKCPFCKGIGFLERENAKCLKCLIKWSPKEMSDYSISVEKRNGVARLKSFLTDVPDIIRAKEIVVNHDIEGTIKLRTRLIRGPIPVGLRSDRYAITYVELI